MRQLEVCQQFSDLFVPYNPDQDDISVRFDPNETEQTAGSVSRTKPGTDNYQLLRYALRRRISLPVPPYSIWPYSFRSIMNRQRSAGPRRPDGCPRDPVIWGSIELCMTVPD
jgi:hypothetical protein